MKGLFKLLWWAVKWSFIVCFVFILSLFFRVQELPHALVSRLTTSLLPTNVVVLAESVRFGFVEGLTVRALKVYDTTSGDALRPLATARALTLQPFTRRLTVDELTYARLPEGYYAPGNTERDEPLHCSLPTLAPLTVELTRPAILGVRPASVTASVQCTEKGFAAERIRLDWPDEDEPMFLDGFCRVDLVQQMVVGEVRGTAKQHHIRPLLEALDIPIAVAYMDAFTEVPGKVPAVCGWRVNLVNNDFDLDLDLDPAMGRYNGVSLRHATGRLGLHVYTRRDTLNYTHTFGPIVAHGPKGEPLEGTVTVAGLDGTNTVTVSAKSALPVADLLKVGGFTGEYVDQTVIGNASCDLKFVFPRTMGDDLSLLGGQGHIEVRDGQLMRMKGFSGLLELLADKVPGVSWLTDSTQASCDYVLRDGLFESDNIYIEGTLFSLKMFGAYDMMRDRLDFTVRVQFSKKDSVVGRILHPLAWPFTKLLLEFRLTGTPENPQWEYLSVIDRVVEATKGATQK